MLEANPNLVREPNEYGWTPLHNAAISGDGEIIRYLLDNGAPVDAQESYGETPLHYAVEQGRHGVVVILLEYGASLVIQNNHGKTALHSATEKDATGDEEVEIVRALLQAGADPNAKDKHGKTPLHRVAEADAYHAVELSRMLIETGAELTARDEEGKTPFDSAYWSRRDGLKDILRPETVDTAPARVAEETTATVTEPTVEIPEKPRRIPDGFKPGKEAWYRTLAEAEADATRSGRDILAVVTDLSPCDKCEEMENRIFNDRSFTIAFAAEFAFLKIDVASKEQDLTPKEKALLGEMDLMEAGSPKTIYKPRMWVLTSSGRPMAGYVCDNPHRDYDYDYIESRIEKLQKQAALVSSADESFDMRISIREIDALFEQGKGAPALGRIEELLKQNPSAEIVEDVLRKKIQALTSLGRHAEVIDTADAYLKTYEPATPSLETVDANQRAFHVQVMKASSCIASGKWQTLLFLANHCLAKYGNGLSGQHEQLLLFYKGKAHFELKDFDAAESALESAKYADSYSRFATENIAPLIKKLEAEKSN